MSNAKLIFFHKMKVTQDLDMKGNIVFSKKAAHEKHIRTSTWLIKCSKNS